jgi:hypothetical protein
MLQLWETYAADRLDVKWKNGLWHFCHILRSPNHQSEATLGEETADKCCSGCNLSFEHKEGRQPSC